MRDLIKRLRPDQFGDLVALVALFRPGPLQSGMVDDFMTRKHASNKADIDYLHPDLKPVLEETYGVILYQEQVMQIAQVLAGYTLGGADLLRRAMGKKKPAEMAKQREIFVTGATERGVTARTATRIFDLMEKFAGYGFNKSHSAAYAVLSYQTAYLKAHYPAAFMAAVMSADLQNTDRLVTLKDDCRQLGLKLLGPDINRSNISVQRVRRSHDPLRPRRDQRHGSRRRRFADRGARRARTFREPCRVLPSRRSRKDQPARTGGAGEIRCDGQRSANPGAA